MTKDNSATENAALEPCLSVDIAIVGAGMVGAALAASLRNTNLSIALVDGQSPESLQRCTPQRNSVEDFEARVSALTLASQQLLDDVGAWQYLSAEQTMHYQKMHVWDHLGTAKIDFNAAELYQDALGAIVENQSIVSALHKGLAGQANVSNFFGRRLVKMVPLEPCFEKQGHDEQSSDEQSHDEHMLSLDNGQTIRCKLVVAADGANSKVRSWASMPTREWDYQHHAIVATVKTANKHAKTCWQRFSETGPIAFLPLQDNQDSEQFCSIVWSQEPERANYLMSLSDDEFRSVLAQEVESSLGAVEGVSKRVSIPLRQRHAKAYTKPGIVLMGDAAHVIHPLAGQGVNLGFKDVAVLSDILQLADKQDLRVNHPVFLKRYQRQRQGDNLLMMGAMEGFKRLFAEKDPLVRMLRNVGLNWVDKQSFIKNQIAKHAMGLSL